MLICQNLSIGYTNPIKSHLSFEIREGEITFLNGKNGSGKSTLIKTILKEIVPLSGSLNWNISMNTVSYLPQINNSEAHFSYTISEVLKIYNVPQKFLNLLSSNLLSQNWVKASGGEKQMAMILTKIKENTNLLILDEPFNHLDTESVETIKKLLTTLMTHKIIRSLLLVSHFKIHFDSVKQKEIWL